VIMGWRIVSARDAREVLAATLNAACSGSEPRAHALPASPHCASARPLQRRSRPSFPTCVPWHPYRGWQGVTLGAYPSVREGSAMSARLSAVAAIVLVTASARAQTDQLECFKMKDVRRKAVVGALLQGIAPPPGCTIKAPAKLVCLPTIDG